MRKMMTAGYQRYPHSARRVMAGSLLSKGRAIILRFSRMLASRGAIFRLSENTHRCCAPIVARNVYLRRPAACWPNAGSADSRHASHTAAPRSSFATTKGRACYNDEHDYLMPKTRLISRRCAPAGLKTPRLRHDNATATAGRPRNFGARHHRHPRVKHRLPRRRHTLGLMLERDDYRRRHAIRHFAPRRRRRCYFGRHDALAGRR